MTMNSTTAENDLAFMRALVNDDGADNRRFGLIYMSAGLLYGLQCLMNGALLLSAAPVSPLVWMAVGWGPTIIFLALLFRFMKTERAQPSAGGATQRAIKAAFTGGGLANLVLALVFGWVAYQKGDWAIWLLFPVVVCVIQGAMWYTTAVLRRRTWQGLTAAGWFISAALLGGVISQTGLYILILGVAFFLCMALPGYIMLREQARSRNAQAKRAA